MVVTVVPSVDGEDGREGVMVVSSAMIFNPSALLCALIGRVATGTVGTP